ncbi:acyl-CoA dehydrogenase family protein [Kocuria flava]|uniref:acyl-CoA dehydrogenase family protein n=1 Tax=Kocuria flava TaxID=446860 RepID=UPI000C79FDCF|nr:acyl-CoA dehydrogenase family protein [Kocuria flava]
MTPPTDAPRPHAPRPGARPAPDGGPDPAGGPVAAADPAAAAAALRAADAGVPAAVLGEALAPALAAARRLGAELPGPGEGRTGALWQRLAGLARLDPSLARVVEPHLDALAILRQAGLGELAGLPATWGVWAAEAAGRELTARPSGSGWELTGTKAWCSLAAHLDRAVVTAGTGGGRRRAFAVDLSHPGAVPDGTAGWCPAGLRDVPTGDVRFDAVPAVPVGGDGWYLERPGFAWGGIGVAACWWGGAAGVADLLWEDAVGRARPGRRPLDQVGLAALGAVDALLHPAREVLAGAAEAVDAGRAGGRRGAVLALRTRRAVARAAEAVVAEVSAATGPGPLTGSPEHVRRVAALQVWVRQEHAQRDAAALGAALLAAGERPW